MRVIHTICIGIHKRNNFLLLFGYINLCYFIGCVNKIFAIADDYDSDDDFLPSQKFRIK